jgi:MFS family permease
MAEGSDSISPLPPDSAFSNTVRAFAHRNYRLFFGGQLVSLIGTFLTQVATVWLVYKLTNSAWLLGLVTFAGQIPMFVLSPFAGVWADRVNRQKMLVITQSLASLESFGLAAVAFSLGRGWIDAHQLVWGFTLLNLTQGVINAFDMPCRQAFLVEMIEKREDLANAIALNSTMVHGARLIGPALAGLLMHFVGATLCFFLDGASYFAVIAALIAMQIKPRVHKPPRSVWLELKEGFSYVWGFEPIRALLLLMGLLSLTGMPAISVLMPVFAKNFGGITHGDLMLGLLMSSSGAGALVGAVYLASRRTVVGLGHVIAIAAVVFGAGIICFGFSPWLWLSMPIAAIIGCAMLMNFAGSNTMMQTLTEDDMRGRVMSFFTMAFIGMTPFGSLLAGYLVTCLRFGGSEEAGAVHTLILQGAISVVAALSFARKLPALRKIVRPIYVLKGILPQETASGITSSEEVVPAAK